MGTRATIRFKDGNDEYFIYRGHDGYPSNVQADIEETLLKIENRWSGPEIGSVVSCFIGFTFNEKSRCPNYELTPCFHGDESYRYYVDWDEKNNKWNLTIN